MPKKWRLAIFLITVRLFGLHVAQTWQKYVITAKNVKDEQFVIEASEIWGRITLLFHTY